MSKPSNEIVDNLNKFFQNLSQGKKAAFVVCFCLFFVAVLFLPGYTDKFDRIFQDLSQNNLSGFISASPELAVVAIDTETLEGTKQRWPWSRTQFAELVRSINSFEPKVIIFDIVFQHSELSDDGFGDEVLAKAIKEAGNVALIGFVDEEITDTGNQKRQYRSLKKFRDVAYCDGYIQSFIDPDSKIRTFSISDSRFGEDSCLLKVARQTRKTAEAINAMSSLPAKSQIVFSRKNGGIPLYRGLDLIEGKVSGDFLKDKIVIVGATAQVLHDYHKTCMGLISGPEILTSSLDTIITGRASSPDSSILARILFAILGLVVSMILALRKRFQHVLVSIGIYVSTLLLLYHFFTMVFIFVPLSCFFITWAFMAVSYNLIKNFIELVEQQIAKAEAALAGQIQAELFPGKFIITDNYSIRGICLPCDSTGGDFFDYFELEDNNIIFVLGDVAGHGFSAAILTVMAKTTIQLLRQKSMVSPETIVSTLNEIIFELVKKKKFMTLAVGHINVVTHQLNLVLAGHLPPVVINSSGDLQELKNAGFPMGIVRKLPIKSLSCELQPGDSIVLFTDGIVEALNWKNEQYTFQAWYDFLQKTMPGFQINCALEELLVEVNEHKAGRSFDDDVTYVIVQRNQQKVQAEK
ncbi:MAG: SpoIIE family protein phosphatase [Candidatus Riflebacteria bacterium]|nr:SpoIIE family protein phosphatase [Candidatus Riflebacteria bacterium]